jgi:hypothetical protein
VRRLRTCLLLLALFATPRCATEAPTGVDTADLRGTWSGSFSNTSLLGRSLTGEVDWIFEPDRFRIIFFSDLPGQPERIEGTWKFASQKVVLTLQSSFPIDTDIGAQDTLFVSILRDEMSIKTIGQAEILLRKTRAASRPTAAPFLAAVLPPAGCTARAGGVERHPDSRSLSRPTCPDHADLRSSLPPPV